MADQRGGRPPLVAERRRPAAKAAAAKPAAKPAKAAAAPRRARTRRAARGPWPVRLVTGLLGWVFRMVVRLAVAGAAVVALVVGFFVAQYYVALPDLDAVLDARARGSVTMLDRDGQTFAWRGEQFGGFITADTVSPHLKNAVVATEDRRFYRHLGVSPRGIAGAIRINLAEGRGPFSGNGGSTITQQVAKLLCLGVPYDRASGMTEADYEADCRRGSIERKLREVPYALALELKFTKDEILTIYLNRAYMGAGARGFEAAAQRYFGTSAANVTPAQAAMLAGLLTAPSRFAPTSNLERSQARAATVIRLMQEQGYLTEGQAQAAMDNPATLSAAAEARAGGYFADWVMGEGPDFLTRDTTEDVVIRTTFDARLQRAAEEAVREVFATRVREGSEAEVAVVVMSADGAVRAMVGGRDVQAQGAFNRASQALRQTGSSFKPFIYAAALDMGYSPLDLVVDEPLTIDIPGSGPWSPQNYDRDFAGRVTLTEALARSLNIPAVKISEFAGRDTVSRIAAEFGLKNDLAAGPALALGVSESTLLEMTGAYAGILNGGTAVTPYGIEELRLQGDPTPLMGKEGGMGTRVIAEEAARQLVWMMSKVVTEGTGGRAALPDRPSAGKTGTTSAARDAWYVGFTADYVAGVWMGYDDNRPLTGVTGAGLPAEIWHEVMVRVHEGLPVRELPMEAPRAGWAEAPAPGEMHVPWAELQDQLAQPQPQPQVPQPAPQPQQDPVTNAINSVLDALFGGPVR